MKPGLNAATVTLAPPAPVTPHVLAARAGTHAEPTARAIAFMKDAASANAPVLFCLTSGEAPLSALPHPDVAGRSGTGRRADMPSEMDNRSGEVPDAIDRLGLRDDTLVTRAGDDGPGQSPGHLGTAGSRRDPCSTALESSLRAPVYLRWPGVTPEGRVGTEIVPAVDILPSQAGFAGTTSAGRALHTAERNQRNSRCS